MPLKPQRTRRLAAALGRLASWADRRLIPAVLCTLLSVDMLVGLNWLLSPPNALSSPAYDTGERVMTLDQWGVVYIGLASAAAAAFLSGGRRFISGYIVGGLIAAVWGFWTVMFLVAPMGREGASYTLAALAFGMTALHMLAGLASTHHPSPHDLVHAQAAARARVVAHRDGR